MSQLIPNCNDHCTQWQHNCNVTAFATVQLQRWPHLNCNTYQLQHTNCNTRVTQLQHHHTSIATHNTYQLQHIPIATHVSHNYNIPIATHMPHNYNFTTTELQHIWAHPTLAMRWPSVTYTTLFTVTVWFAWLYYPNKSTCMIIRSQGGWCIWLSVRVLGVCGWHVGVHPMNVDEL